MKDSEYLIWLRARLINHYDENPLTDYVTRLDPIIHRLQKIELRSERRAKEKKHVHHKETH